MSAQFALPSQPMRVPSWPATRLLGRAVVHARLVTRVGEVVDVVFSPEHRQLVGLLIGPPVADGGLLQTLRRVLGVDVGLRFVPIQRVISLNSDMVMIDTEPGAAPLPDRRHLPRLSLTHGSVVVTMQGQRLGRLADLQLDAEGRRLAGYIVERDPPATAAPHAVPSVMGQSAPPTAPAAPAASSRFMIPARFRVRVGRGLIVAGEDVSRPVMTTMPPPGAPATGTAAATSWPAPQWATDSPVPPPESPDELAAPPDAPTEQLKPSV